MKALVIGGATIDIIASIDPDNIECISLKNATNSFLMLEQGTKVDALNIDTQIGGGATNAAVAMSRLGAEVSTLIKLGNDNEAKRILTHLKKEHIDTSFVTHHPTAQTGRSIIISSHERNAGIFVHRGANKQLKRDDIPDDLFANIDIVYVSTLSGASAHLFPQIIKLARQAGAFIACNPGIRQISQRKSDLLDVLQYVDLLALNKEEAQALAQGFVEVSSPPMHKDGPELITKSLINKDMSILFQDFARKIYDAGCPYLLVTNGAEGAYTNDGETLTFCPALPSNVVSTVGAGDAYIATFTFAIAQKLPMNMALKMATCNSSQVTECLDTQSNLMTLDNIQHQLKALPEMDITSYRVTP